MIDTKAIRSKILDLAMHGKLSMQYEYEAVDFDYEVTCNPPYKIPTNWKWVTIESIITKDIGGGTPSKSVDEYWKGTIPWMSVKDFSSAKNGVLEDTIDHITQAGLDNSSSNLVDTSAIIVCMRMALGKIVKLKQPMAINQDLRAIWLNPCVERDFFVFYYSTLKVEGHGMTVAGINKKQLMSYLMPLPPLAEQQRIVEKIDQAFSILDTIDELQKQYSNNLSVLKSKVIDLAIKGKLTEQLSEDGTAEELYNQIQKEKQTLIKEGKIKKEKPLPEITEEEIPFGIPDNWKWVRLGSAFRIEMGQSPDGNSVSYNGEGLEFHQGKVFFGTKFIHDSGQRTTMPTKIAEPDSVLLCVRAPVGKVNITPREICIGRGLSAISTIAGVVPSYLYYVLITCEKAFENQATGSTFSAINSEIVRKQLVPLPPLAEQKRITAKIDEVLKAIDA